MSEEQPQHPDYRRARCRFVEASRKVGSVRCDLREDHVAKGVGPKRVRRAPVGSTVELARPCPPGRSRFEG